MNELQCEEFSLECLQKAANFIKNKVPFSPKLLIICGSGLGGLADTIKDPISLNYEDIPSFPISTVKGHAGKLIFGTLSGVKVVCMKGRFHYFEGYSLQKIAIPIRILKLIGVQGLIVTNAAGATNKTYRVGDIMVIKDHVNFLAFGGQHPLRGPNDTFFGQRFFSMTKAYDKDLIKIARNVAEKVGISDFYHVGVYGQYGGPNYETIAEVRLLQVLGVDAVGMSTIPEVLVANHCRMSVFGFSLITNVCIDSYDEENEPDHDKILTSIEPRAEKLKEFVTRIVEETRERWI